MIDIQTEWMLTIQQACEYLAERGFEKPKELTIRRWIWYGSNGRYLEHVKLGHRVYTSKEALARYASAVDPPPPETYEPFDMSLFADSSLFRDDPPKKTVGRAVLPTPKPEKPEKAEEIRQPPKRRRFDWMDPETHKRAGTSAVPVPKLTPEELATVLDLARGDDSDLATLACVIHMASQGAAVTAIMQATGKPGAWIRRKIRSFVVSRLQSFDGKPD